MFLGSLKVTSLYLDRLSFTVFVVVVFNKRLFSAGVIDVTFFLSLKNLQPGNEAKVTFIFTSLCLEGDIGFFLFL